MNAEVMEALEERRKAEAEAREFAERELERKMQEEAAAEEADVAEAAAAARQEREAAQVQSEEEAVSEERGRVLIGPVDYWHTADTAHVAAGRTVTSLAFLMGGQLLATGDDSGDLLLLKLSDVDREVEVPGETEVFSIVAANPARAEPKLEEGEKRPSDAALLKARQAEARNFEHPLRVAIATAVSQAVVAAYSDGDLVEYCRRHDAPVTSDWGNPRDRLVAHAATDPAVAPVLPDNVDLGCGRGKDGMARDSSNTVRVRFTGLRTAGIGCSADVVRAFSAVLRDAGSQLNAGTLAPWTAPHVVGCARRGDSLWYGFDGRWGPPYGGLLDVPAGSSLRPAVSGGVRMHLVLNFGGAPWVHGPPFRDLPPAFTAGGLEPAAELLRGNPSGSIDVQTVAPGVVSLRIVKPGVTVGFGGLAEGSCFFEVTVAEDGNSPPQLGWISPDFKTSTRPKEAGVGECKSSWAVCATKRRLLHVADPERPGDTDGGTWVHSFQSGGRALQRSLKPQGKTFGLHSGGHSSYITALCGQRNALFSSSLDGAIKGWSVASHRLELQWTCTLPSGFAAKLACDDAASVVVALWGDQVGLVDVSSNVPVEDPPLVLSVAALNSSGAAAEATLTRIPSARYVRAPCAEAVWLSVSEEALRAAVLQWKGRWIVAADAPSADALSTWIATESHTFDSICDKVEGTDGACADHVGGDSPADVTYTACGDFRVIVSPGSLDDLCMDDGQEPKRLRQAEKLRAKRIRRLKPTIPELEGKNATVVCSVLSQCGAHVAMVVESQGRSWLASYMRGAGGGLEHGGSFPIGAGSRVKSLCTDADGSSIYATLANGSVLNVSWSGRVDRVLGARYRSRLLGVEMVSASPTGSHVALVRSDGVLDVLAWMRSASRHERAPVRVSGAVALAHSGSGEWLAVGTASGTVELLRCSAPLARVEPAYVRSLRWSGTVEGDAKELWQQLARVRKVDVSQPAPPPPPPPPPPTPDKPSPRAPSPAPRPIFTPVGRPPLSTPSPLPQRTPVGSDRVSVVREQIPSRWCFRNGDTARVTKGRYSGQKCCVLKPEAPGQSQRVRWAVQLPGAATKLRWVDNDVLYPAGPCEVARESWRRHFGTASDVLDVEADFDRMVQSVLPQPQDNSGCSRLRLVLDSFLGNFEERKRWREALTDKAGLESVFDSTEGASKRRRLDTPSRQSSRR